MSDTGGYVTGGVGPAGGGAGISQRRLVTLFLMTAFIRMTTLVRGAGLIRVARIVRAIIVFAARMVAALLAGTG